jgi:hypothetical protein
MEILVRRQETLECLECYGEGEVSRKMYHDDVKWSKCGRCGGEGEVEEHVYYWTDGLPTSPEDLNEMDGTRASRFQL